MNPILLSTEDSHKKCSRQFLGIPD
ncbi:uncharacterized protein METZ01_LOCUS338616 [marine metagenome]|uniref:Uncharacterized protein n=1 Tax=marine metagenome TaxID=408172 RepID=A0A382QM07_9ZZZZ